jgi:FkbM family methyltransferase
MNLLKPYFVHRPWQIVLRAIRHFWQPAKALTTLPWGEKIRINPREAIGNAIWLTGVHEIATTEAIFRLLPPGGTAVDAGANIGYMTLAMLAAVGDKGGIIACEPHPRIFQELVANVRLNQPGRHESVHVRLCNVALSDSAGTALLALDPEERNQGIGSLDGAGACHIPVEKITLDELAADAKVDLLKIDVEGHELKVINGALKMISEGRIQNIIFENHEGCSSHVPRILSEMGYAIFRLGWSIDRPLLYELDNEAVPCDFQAPDYLAAKHPDYVVNAFKTGGWRCLHR